MNSLSTSGLSHGKQWGALPRNHERLEWSLDPDGPMVQGPYELDTYRGHRLFLHLEPEEYALLVTEDSLRAIYLDGAHHLEIGTGLNQVPTDGRLILLSSNQTLNFRFAGESALHAADGSGVIARCSLRLAKPARFFFRILRPVGRDWSSDSLSTVLGSVARQACQDLLDNLGGSGNCHAGTLQSILMDLKPSSLDEHLVASGLFCAAFAAYTDALPVESGRIDLSESDSLQTEELLHN